jgi:hypothetical protein
VGIEGREKMQPGEDKAVDNALELTLSVWVEKHGTVIEIHLTGDGELFSHTTVNNNPASPRYHRTMFRNLRRLLLAKGKWPFGIEGMETEGEKRVG